MFINQIKQALYKTLKMRVIKGLWISREAFVHNVAFSEFNKIYGRSIVSNVTIGRYSYINGASVCNAKIGAFCSIGPNVKIGFGKHPVNYLSTHPYFFTKNNDFGERLCNEDCYEQREETVIGNDVWIGAGAFIKDGVCISNGAIIGAGAVVTRDVEAYSVVCGVPAKMIKKRFSEELITAIQESRWYEFSLEKIKTIKQCFQKVITDVEDIKPVLVNKND